MDLNSLVIKLKELRSSGKSKEDIYKQLLTEGNKVDSIQDAYEVIDSETHKDDAQKKTINIIVAAAAILIGVGIFSFIAANWQFLSKFTKVLIIVTSMSTSYLLGYYIREIKNLKKTGGALIFLGLLIYGAGIFLMGQIFNIQANWPDGFILWMFGALALAFAINLFAAFYLAIILAIVPVFGHPYYIFTEFNDKLPMTSSLLLLVATAVCFATAYLVYKKQPPKEFF